MDRTCFLCSPQGHRPVKIKHTSLDPERSRNAVARVAARFARTMLLLVLVFTAVAALAQQPQTIDQIRVIGNRRIPKETVLARLFTHVGDTYDPISVERDFNSLWNTGYFENLRIEREDSEKGIILNVFVQEKPTIREINYPGLNSVSQSDLLDRFKKEKVGLTAGRAVRPHQGEARRSGDPRSAGRARPPVRHHQDGGQDHPAGLGAGELQYQGRPHGQSRPDPLHRQPAHQQPSAAPRHGQPEAGRAFRTR